MKKRNPPRAVYIILVLLILYVPIIIIMLYSFHSKDRRHPLVWGPFTTQYYETLMSDSSILGALKNSVIVGVISSAVAAVVGTLGAYGVSAYRPPLRGTMQYISSLPMMLPEIIFGIVYLSFFSLVKMPLGILSLISAHSAFCIPYVYLIVKARIAGMQRTYMESARDLGASGFRAFIDIMLPMILPAVFSGMLLAFAMSFDDVIISAYLTSPTFDTLPVKIFSMTKTVVPPAVYALTSLIFAGTLILAIIFALLMIPRKRRPGAKASAII